MARRHLAWFQECPHRCVRIHGVDAAAGAERNVDLSVAALWSIESAYGGAEPADREPVAQVGRAQSALCVLAHALYVHHDHGRDCGDGIQPVREYSLEPENLV